MKQLSTICWLAVFIGVVPFLAIPLWLMKLLLVLLAVLILLLVGYLRWWEVDFQKTFTANNPPEISAPAQQDKPSAKKAKEKQNESSNPKETTSPDTDRIARRNSYASRQKNLHS